MESASSANIEPSSSAEAPLAQPLTQLPLAQPLPAQSALAQPLAQLLAQNTSSSAVESLELQISKGQVLDYIKEHDKHACELWLRSTYIDKYGSESCASLEAYKGTVRKVHSDYQKANMSKRRNPDELENLRSSPYRFPRKSMPSKKRKRFDDILHAEAAETVASVLHTSLEEKDRELGAAQKSLVEKDYELDVAQRKIAHLTSLITVKNKELKRTRGNRDYYKQKVDKVETKLEAAATSCDVHDTELQMAFDTIKNMKQEQREASDTIKTLEDHIKRRKSKTVVTYTGAHFTTEFTCLVHKLLEHHVGYNHIGLVIQECLEFVEKVPSKLPSRSTIVNMNATRLGLDKRADKAASELAV
ncbi:dynactin subunit 1-like [Patiria miniata]|uniref:Uncharacterized protein n=1 Tax=Patiria miniata TaxID=46514 RepID=A0A914AKR8_PATMI|nr:dynactin subunit 1-like [Patiria miniata]